MLANSGWLLTDRVLGRFFTLVVGGWAARHFGPGRYGVLAYAIALLAVVAPLAMLGLEAIVVRNGAQDHAKSLRTLGTAVFLITASWLAECVGRARLTQMTGHHR
jgi:O-antigen/teichoic acid export membrane protein